MTCERAREMFSDLFEDALSERERAEVEAHLAHCARCRRAYEQFCYLVNAFRALPEVPVEPLFAERVMARVRAEEARRRERRVWSLLPVVLPRAAAVVAVGAIVAALVVVGVGRLRPMPRRFAAAPSAVATAPAKAGAERREEGLRAEQTPPTPEAQATRGTPAARATAPSTEARAAVPPPKGRAARITRRTAAPRAEAGAPEEIGVGEAEEEARPSAAPEAAPRGRAGPAGEGALSREMLAPAPGIERARESAAGAPVALRAMPAREEGAADVVAPRAPAEVAAGPLEVEAAPRWRAGGRGPRGAPAPPVALPEPRAEPAVEPPVGVTSLAAVVDHVVVPVTEGEFRGIVSGTYNFELDNVSVTFALRTVAKVSNTTIVIAEPLRGRVTTRMRAVSAEDAIRRLARVADLIVRQPAPSTFVVLGQDGEEVWECNGGGEEDKLGGPARF